MVSRSESTPDERVEPRATARKRTEDTLGAYLGEISAVDVLTAEQERALAAEIAGLRVAYWKSLLSYPPFVGPICDFVLAREPDEPDESDAALAPDLPLAELAEARHAARAYRDRESRSNRERYELSRAALAQAMAELDLDGDLADRIAADLEAIDADRKDALTLSVTCPPRASRPFAAYLQRTRTHANALRTTKNHFVRANLRLVVSIARRLDHGLMPLPDLIQEGNFGLLKAVDRFDGRKGFRFSTYATWWIRHAVNRALANKGRTVRLPAHVSADLQRVRRANREHELRTGAPLTVDELASATGLSPIRLRRLENLALESTVSLDAPLAGGDGRTLADQLCDPGSEEPSAALQFSAISDSLEAAIAELEPIEADILRARFGVGADDDFEAMTLRELGLRHHLSRERIRQLQERALLKLRVRFERRGRALG